MAPTMNKKYIKDHMSQIHTPDSWGRAIIYHMLSESAESIGEKSVSSATVNGVFHVSPVEPTGCIQLCYETPIGPICVHVNV